MSIVIRPGQPDDRAFVYGTFVNGYSSSPYARGTPPSVLAGLLEPLLHHPDWDVAVACPPDDLGAIVGWMLYRPEVPEAAMPPALGWLHVRGAFRRRGVGRALLEHAGIGRRLEMACAFITPDAAKLAARHGLVLRFRPYLALEAGLSLRPAAPDGA